MFPAALQGRHALPQKCRKDRLSLEQGLISPMMMQHRHHVAQQALGIVSQQEDTGDLSVHGLDLGGRGHYQPCPRAFWLLYHVWQQQETAYRAIHTPKLRPSTLLSIEEFESARRMGVGLDGNAPTVLGKYNGPGCRPKDCELDLKIDGTHKYLLQKDSRVAVMMSCLLAHGRECL